MKNDNHASLNVDRVRCEPKKGGSKEPGVMASSLKFNIRVYMRSIKHHVWKSGVYWKLRSVNVAANRVGEWVKFSLNGGPEPSSAVLLAGSGRSGTTWLMEILAISPGIQPIFEPLQSFWVDLSRRVTGLEPEMLRVRARYLRPGVEYPEWEDFLYRVLKGQVRSVWTDRLRTSLFPDRFVIKSIRANLMLAFIHENFQPKIIYMLRHPCAVIASRLDLGWQADVMDILKQEPLVEDHLRPWVAAIEEERDNLGAHAIWWAVENAVARRQLVNIPHLALTYEQLCLEPEGHIPEVFSFLGLPMPEFSNLQSVIQRPSKLSIRDVTYTSTVDRLSSWKKQIKSEDQKRILDWAHRLGVTTYSDQIVPVNAAKDAESR